MTLFLTHCAAVFKIGFLLASTLNVLAQVAQARNMSIAGASALLRNVRNIRICMGKKPIVSVTYENERISIKNSLPYIKCVLRLSCVVHEAIYGRFMSLLWFEL